MHSSIITLRIFVAVANVNIMNYIHHYKMNDFVFHLICTS